MLVQDCMGDDSMSVWVLLCCWEQALIAIVARMAASTACKKGAVCMISLYSKSAALECCTLKHPVATASDTSLQHECTPQNRLCDQNVFDL